MRDLSGRTARVWIALLLCSVALSFHATVCSAYGQGSSVPTIHVTSQLVTVDALVADKKSGRIVQGLSMRDFKLSEDGMPQELRYFSQDTLPLSIVLLFDLTASVRPQLKSLGAGAETVLAHLKPEDEVAVMTFDESVRSLQPFTTDRGLAAKAVREAATMKSDAPEHIDESMYGAVDEGMKSTLPNSRRVLVWLTDDAANRVRGSARGKDGERLRTQDEATEKLERSGEVVAGLIERSATGDVLIGLAKVAGGVSMGGVQRYAELTGGPVLKSAGKETAKQLAALLEEIRGRYTLGYVPSADKPPGTLCHISMELTAEAVAAHPELKQGHFVVRTRSTYYR